MPDNIVDFAAKVLGMAIALAISRLIGFEATVILILTIIYQKMPSKKD